MYVYVISLSLYIYVYDAIGCRVGLAGVVVQGALARDRDVVVHEVHEGVVEGLVGALGWSLSYFSSPMRSQRDSAKPREGPSVVVDTEMVAKGSSGMVAFTWSLSALPIGPASPM